MSSRHVRCRLALCYGFLAKDDLGALDGQDNGQDGGKDGKPSRVIRFHRTPPRLRGETALCSDKSTPGQRPLVDETATFLRYARCRIWQNDDGVARKRRPKPGKKRIAGSRRGPFLCYIRTKHGRPWSQPVFLRYFKHDYNQKSDLI